MSFHLLGGAVQANLISLAGFRVRSATVFPGCQFIPKHFLPSRNTYHYRFFAKFNNLYSFVIRTFGFQF